MSNSKNTYQMSWVNNVQGLSWPAWTEATGHEDGVWDGSFSTYPGATLETVQDMVYVEGQTNLAAGGPDFYIDCGWNDGTIYIAVRIVVSPQVFHMGYRPYYQVAITDDPSIGPVFKDVVDDPADPYTKNFDSTWGTGSLSITSDSEHAGISLNCFISFVSPPEGS